MTRPGQQQPLPAMPKLLLPVLPAGWFTTGQARAAIAADPGFTVTEGTDGQVTVTDGLGRSKPLPQALRWLHRRSLLVSRRVTATYDGPLTEWAVTPMGRRATHESGKRPDTHPKESREADPDDTQDPDETRKHTFDAHPVGSRI